MVVVDDVSVADVVVVVAVVAVTVVAVVVVLVVDVAVVVVVGHVSHATGHALRSDSVAHEVPSHSLGSATPRQRRAVAVVAETVVTVEVLSVSDVCVRVVSVVVLDVHTLQVAGHILRTSALLHRWLLAVHNEDSLTPLQLSCVMVDDVLVVVVAVLLVAVVSVTVPVVSVDVVLLVDVAEVAVAVVDVIVLVESVLVVTEVAVTDVSVIVVVVDVVGQLLHVTGQNKRSISEVQDTAKHSQLSAIPSQRPIVAVVVVCDVVVEVVDEQWPHVTGH